MTNPQLETRNFEVRALTGWGPNPYFDNCQNLAGMGMCPNRRTTQVEKQYGFPCGSLSTEVKRVITLINATRRCPPLQVCHKHRGILSFQHLTMKEIVYKTEPSCCFKPSTCHTFESLATRRVPILMLQRDIKRKLVGGIPICSAALKEELLQGQNDLGVLHEIAET